MTKLVFNLHNGFYRAYDNDAAVQASHVHGGPSSGDGSYKIVTVSQSDFDALINETKTISDFDGTTVTFEDRTAGFATQADLEHTVNQTKNQLVNWEEGHSSHADYNAWRTFRIALDDLDYTTITFPNTKSLKTICEDQSITWKNIIQLP